MEIPAPRDAAVPTWKAFEELCVAKAAAKTGANVDTEPSINPTSPGWTICSTKLRFAVSCQANQRDIACLSNRIQVRPLFASNNDPS